MVYALPQNLPVTTAINSRKSHIPSIQASRRSFYDFEFDEEEDDLGISPLLDVDFSDLELDNQEEFSFKEEEDLYLDEEDEDFEDEEE
jgi:hypothetical protein